MSSSPTSISSRARGSELPNRCLAPRCQARSARRRGRNGRVSLLIASVLVVNAGSTSLKLTRVDLDERSHAVGSLEEAVGTVDAVAHRIVHGGPRFRAPRLVDDAVAQEPATLPRLPP